MRRRRAAIGQLTKSLAAAWAQRRHPRQRGRAGLDRDGADEAPRRGRRPLGADPGAHADEPLGASRAMSAAPSPFLLSDAARLHHRRDPAGRRRLPGGLTAG
jgi:hypothetical protein